MAQIIWHHLWWLCEHKYLHFGFCRPRHSEWEWVSITLRLRKKVWVEVILVLAFEDLEKRISMNGRPIFALSVCHASSCSPNLNDVEKKLNINSYFVCTCILIDPFKSRLQKSTNVSNTMRMFTIWCFPMNQTLVKFQRWMKWRATSLAALPWIAADRSRHGMRGTWVRSMLSEQEWNAVSPFTSLSRVSQCVCVCDSGED